MKKIILGVIVFLASISCVYADTSTYRVQYNNGGEVKVKQLPSINKYFDLYLDNEVEINDYKRIHNIAYYAGNTLGDAARITAQIMIWEEVYPNYTFTVYDGDNNIYSINEDKSIINRYVNRFNNPCTLDGKVSEVTFGGSIMYTSNISMVAYTADKYRISIDNKYIHVDDITGIGTNTLKFFVNEIIEDNKITANGPSLGDFSTTVILYGNRINFNISANDDYLIEMYNKEDNSLIGTYEINKNHNYIEYGLNTNVYLKDITNSNIYKPFDDIEIIEDNSHLYNIELHKEYITKKATFNAPLIDKNYNIVNMNIYKESELYKEIRCNRTCDIDIPIGEYKFINNNTLEESTINVIDNIEFDNSNNYLKALKGNYDITKILFNNMSILFHKDNDYYMLDDFVSGNEIKIEINNILYDVILNNLSYNQEIGLVKELNIELKEKINSEDNINNEVDVIDNNEEVVVIDIPNTNDTFDGGIYYVKKKHYCINNNYYSYIM